MHARTMLILPLFAAFVLVATSAGSDECRSNLFRQIRVAGRRVDAAQGRSGIPGRTKLERHERGFTKIFNGKDLSGWHVMDHQDWHVENGVLWTEGQGGWLRSEKRYADFVWRLEYRMAKDSNSGIFLRATEAGNPAFTGMEIQILDDADKPADVHSSGSIYGASAPLHSAAKAAGEWNQEEISCVGRHVTITLNGHKIQDVDLDDPRFEHAQERPLSKVPGTGHIGLQSHTNRVEFRNLRIRVLKPAA